MLENIKKFFIEEMDSSDHESHTSSERSVTIACCALLLEMAHADSQFSQRERDKIISILQTNFNMAQRDAKELLKLSEHERKESIDLWQFTNYINQTFSHDEKVKVAETLWQVIYTDGKVDKHEEYLMRKLTFLLDIDHQDVIAAKFKARENAQ
jgi:uncharacterized tellurite resistance protein B-like protein